MTTFILVCRLFTHAALFLLQERSTHMHHYNFTIHLLCPYDRCKGETLADGRAKVTISVICPKCGNTYLADLDTMKTYRSKPQRRMGRR